MNDRSFTPLRVILLFLAMSPLTFAQSPPRRLTVSERVSALGRALAGGEEEPQHVTPTAAQGAVEQRTAFPQVNGQQLLPSSRFGGRTTSTQSGGSVNSTHRAGTAQAPSRAATDPAAAGVGQSLSQPAPRTTGQPISVGSTGRGTTARTAVRTNTNLIGDGESVQDQYRLPGLGGSPLPSSVSGQRIGGEGGVREVASDSTNTRPTGNPSTIENRQQAFPTSASAAASAGSPVRNSPQRRTPTHVDASELRHDLAGAYPAAGDNSASATAPHNDTVEQSPQSSEPNATSAIGQRSNEVFTLPTNEGFVSPSTRSATKPVEDSATLNAAPQITPTTQSSTGAGAIPGFDTSPSRTQESPTQGVPTPQSTLTNTTTNAPPAAAILPTQPTTPLASGGSSFDNAPITRGNSANILVTNQAPIIATDIRGPKQIVVGREAVFHVRVHNQGNAAAEGIELTVRIPSWANVIDTNTSTGTVSQAPTMDAAGTLKWQLARLGAGASEALDLKLVPRSSRPLELGVNWTVSPVGSRAVVEVQEPKLEMNVSGPDEVLFGKPQMYRFTLSNPGTGTAENVHIDLYPPGGGEKAAASNTIGNLAPGKSQTIEVELVARDPGKLTIKAIAAGEGELSAAATKEVFCRKPELAIDWRGPEMKYAGTEATFHVRVRNPGTAPAEDVTVRATLPDGAQLTSASEGQTYDAARREIAWRVGSLGPGDDYYMELKCTVTNPGRNQMQLSAATSTGDLTDNKVIETNVVALADLKLEVTDPSGPIAVGADAMYEIRIQNRGASAARDIQIVGMFSAGVEPVGVDGAQYSVSDGRVSFRAIEELSPGRHLVLKIRAQATQPGTHVFRAEVLCRDSEIKLAAEETTRFFADESTTSGSSNQQSDATNGFEPTVR